MEPGDRRLARPPSERYAAGANGAEPAGRPRLARGLGYGIVVAAGLALVWLLFAGALGIDYGTVVLAAIGGWAVGTAVAYGAWGERPHEPVSRLRAGAVALAVAAWLIGTALDWVWSQATLPGSAHSLPERLAQTPFTDWLGGQLSILTGLQLALLAVFSWRAAR